jgi:hypothetical protein
MSGSLVVPRPLWPKVRKSSISDMLVLSVMMTRPFSRPEKVDRPKNIENVRKQGRLGPCANCQNVHSQRCHITIKYRPGKRHVNVDAVSRLPTRKPTPMRHGESHSEAVKMGSRRVTEDPWKADQAALGCRGHEGRRKLAVSKLATPPTTRSTAAATSCSSPARPASSTGSRTSAT